eukprot:765211-Hanusia_phi.AAC.1
MDFAYRLDSSLLSPVHCSDFLCSSPLTLLNWTSFELVFNESFLTLAFDRIAVSRNSLEVSRNFTIKSSKDCLSVKLRSISLMYLFKGCFIIEHRGLLIHGEISYADASQCKIFHFPTGNYSIHVKVSEGKSIEIREGFIATASPARFHFLNPTEVQSASRIMITVTGENFYKITRGTCSLLDANLTLRLISSSLLLCTSDNYFKPRMSQTQSGTLVINWPHIGTVLTNLTVAIWSAPSLDRFEPSSSMLGKILVTVFGRNFRPTPQMSCTVGGDLFGDSQFQSSTKVLCLFQGVRRIGNFTLFLSIAGLQPLSTPGLSLNIVADPTPVAVTPSTGPSDGGTFVRISTAEALPDMPMECEFGAFGGRTGAVRVTDKQLGCLSAAKTSNSPVQVFLLLGNFRSKSDIYFEYSEGGRAIPHATDPSVGSGDGGLWVDIIGTHFDVLRPGCRYGTREALISWVSSTLIRCKTLPITPGPVFWQVKGTNGQYGTASQAFYALEVPEMYSVQPTWAFQGHSITTLTLNGRRFEMSLYVQINGMDWHACEILSNALGTCRLMFDLEPQLVTLRVSNNKRESGKKCCTPFRVLGEPRITQLMPSTGPVYGGGQLTIIGERLLGQGGIRVMCFFEDIETVRASVLSSTAIICIAPPHDIPSVVRIYVSFGEVGSAINKTASFQYTLPCSVEATMQHVQSETTAHVIRILGENFMPNSTSCSFGQHKLQKAVWLTSTMSLCEVYGDISRETSFKFYCDNQLIDERILNEEWSEIRLLSVHPIVGRGGAGAYMELRGIFQMEINNARCIFGHGKTYTEARWLSISLMQCDVPQLVPGNVTVSLSVEDDLVVSNSLLFVFSEQMKILSLKPSRGLIGVQTVLTMLGSFYQTGLPSACRVGNMYNSASIISSSMATCKITSSFMRSVELRLCTTEAGKTCSNVLKFEFEESFAVLKIMPSSGPAFGGTKITLIGSRLASNTTVICKFGHSSMITVAVSMTASLAVCESPAIQAGLIPLTVFESDYMNTGHEFAYLYWSDPKVLSIAPSVAYQDISTTITLKGHGLAPLLGADCKVGAATATLTRQSSGDYVCRVPEGLPAGIYEVTFRLQGVEVSTSDLKLVIEPSVNILEIRPTSGPTRGGTSISLRTRGVGQDVDLGCLIGAFWTRLIKGKRHDAFRCITPPSKTVGEVIVGLASRESALNQTLASRSSRGAWTFTFYDDEQVDAVLPSIVFSSFHNHLTVVGQNFENRDISCLFADHHIARGELITSTRVLCDLSYSIPGLMSVKIANNGVDFRHSNHFVRIEPKIELLLLTPSKGPIIGGIRLTVHHSHLLAIGNCSFKFGNEVVKGQSLPGKFVGVVPPGHSPGNVSVQVLSEARAKVLEFFFEYEEVGMVKLVYPTIGPTDGGSRVTFTTGRLHVQDALACSFEGEMVEAKLESSREEVVCYTPTHREGTVRLELYKGSMTLSGPGIEYVFARTFELEQILPSSGPTGGNSITTIFGRYFQPRTDLFCLFGASATPSTVINSRKLLCQAPESPEGTISISVAFDKQIFSRGHLLYQFYVQIQLDTIMPNVCLAEMPLQVTILGANFDEHVLCDVGTVIGVAVEMVDASRMVLNVPGLPPGQHSIRCSKAGGHRSNVRALRAWPLPMEVVIDPTHSSVRGGTIVRVLARTGFPPTGWKCLFGRIVVDAQVASETTLHCKAPPMPEAGPVEMMLTGPGGDLFKSPRFPFLYRPMNTLRIIDYYPSEGRWSGGTVVHFSACCGMDTIGLVKCVFGMKAVHAFSDKSSSRLVCVSPPGSPGLVQLRVEGVVEDVDESEFSFLYMPDPTLNSVKPSLFVVEERAIAIVTLFGENFMDRKNLRCMFGRNQGVPSFRTSTFLKCSINGLRHGNYSMYVSSGDIMNEESVQVLVTKPVKIVQARCRQRGVGARSSLIRLIGSGFSQDKDIRCSLQGLHVRAIYVSGETMLCYFDCMPCKNVFDLSIEIVDGDRTFKIFAPAEISVEREGARIYSCVPSQGSLDGGTIVTVRGENLGGGKSACRFGSLLSDSLTLVSSTQVMCMSPKHETRVDVEVSVLGVDGQFSDSGIIFLYRPIPQIHGAFPSSVQKGLSTSITVHGSGFEGDSTFCRQNHGHLVDSRMISSPDPFGIHIPENPQYPIVDLSSRFSFYASPQISNLSPSLGSHNGGMTVDVAGSQFLISSRIVFGQAQADCNHISSSQLTCLTPASKSPGLVNVMIVSDVM